MHPYEYEGASWRLLQEVGLDGPVAPEILAVVHRLGLALVPGTSPCVHGVLWEDARRVYFDDRLPRVHALHSIAHEVGHHAARRWNATGRHGETDADALADGLQMPGVGFRRLVRAVGWDATEWQLAYPEVVPSRVFRRAAQVLEGVVVLRVGGRREVHRHEGFDGVDALRDQGALERALYDEVRATGEPVCDRSGVSAWPFRGPGGRAGVVILGELTAWLPRCA